MKRIRKLITVVTACTALVLPILAVGQQPSDRGSTLKAQIDSLRSEAKFAEASVVAKELLEFRQSDTSSKPFQIDDARRLVSTLDRIATLPVTTQQELATAYGSFPKIGAHIAKAEYDEGVTVAEAQLAVFKKALGNDDPVVASSLTNLGILLHRKRDYAGAEPLYREALAIQRKSLGNDHPDVASSLNNLGALLADKGDYAGAEPLYREALATRRAALGNEHPDVAATLNGLAVLLRKQGDYTGAEPLLREALAIRRKAFGNDHPECGGESQQPRKPPQGQRRL